MIDGLIKQKIMSKFSGDSYSELTGLRPKFGKISTANLVFFSSAAIYGICG